MFLTVIMTLHNRLADARISISSVLRQRQSENMDLEFVLVDNNSAEDIDLVYKEVRREAPTTLIRRPVLQSPMAWASARNLGLAVADGEWILSLDPDCVIAPGYLSSLRFQINKAGEWTEMYTGERVFVDGDSIERAAALQNPQSITTFRKIPSLANHGLLRDKRIPDMFNLPELEHSWDYAHGGNVAYSRLAAQSCGGQDPEFDGNHGYEDIEFAYRMITNIGCRLNYAPEMVAYHLESRDRVPQPDRRSRAKNPNWHRICDLIPGYFDFKKVQYRRRQVDISL